MGALKGASDIGATLMTPIDYLLNKTGISDMTNKDRRKLLAEYFKEQADPQSLAFKAGTLGSQIAGTAGVGGVLAKGATVAGRAIPAAAPYVGKLATALETGGFKIGAPAVNTLGRVGDLATRVGAGAVTGGTMAGMINPEEAGTGALIGGLMPPTIQAAGKAGHLAKALVAPMTEKGQEKIIGNVLRRVSGENADEVIKRLKTAAPLVQGSQPTAAEVAESGGMASLQRALKAADPEAYTQRGMEQAHARLQALRGIAGDDAAIAAAKAARQSITQPLYKAADDVVVQADKELGRIFKRMPSGIVERAEKIARMNGEAFNREDLYTGRGLHYIKLALADAVDNPAMRGIGGNESRAILGIKNDLLSWMDKNIPSYGQANKAFAEMSRPVNQMEIGQALLEKASPALADYGALGKETAANYARALRSGDVLAENVTGMRGGLEKAMTPEQMRTLKNVAMDLARKTNADDLGRGVGSNTFQNFAMDNLTQTLGMPGAVRSALGTIPIISQTGRAITGGAKALGGLVYKGSDEAIRRKMAQALLNPRQAAQLMDEATRVALSKGLLERAVYEGGNPLFRSVPIAISASP